MTTGLILHYAPDNASLCVRLALEELGLPYTARLVDRRAKAQKSAAYLALNPNGLIPVLETADGVMFETGAILLWLADQHPGAIFPDAHDVRRATALTKLFWIANTLHPCLRMLFYPDQYAHTAQDEVRAVAKERLVDLLGIMADAEGHLSTEQPNLIACYVAPMLRWCALYGDDPAWFDLSRWASLQAFAEAFEMRPSAQRVSQAEGLGPTPFSSPILPTPPEGSAL